MSEITTTTVTNDHLGVWGAKIVEYNYDKHVVDFQDLMVKITEKRAAAVEGEITPLSKRMENRNKRLSELGNALADISGMQAAFKSDDDGGKWSLDYLKQPSEETRKVLSSLEANLWGQGTSGAGAGEGTYGYYVTKSNCEKAAQLLKTRIDLLNNASSEDMTRLQGIVDRRDQSYSTATTLMQAIGDTRSALVKNF